MHSALSEIIILAQAPQIERTHDHPTTHNRPTQQRRHTGNKPQPQKRRSYQPCMRSCLSWLPACSCQPCMHAMAAMTAGNHEHGHACAPPQLSGPSTLARMLQPRNDVLSQQCMHAGRHACMQALLYVSFGCVPSSAS